MDSQTKHERYHIHFPVVDSSASIEMWSIFGLTLLNQLFDCKYCGLPVLVLINIKQLCQTLQRSTLWPEYTAKLVPNGLEK